MTDGDVVWKRGDSCLFPELTAVTLAFMYVETYGTNWSLDISLYIIASFFYVLNCLLLIIIYSL